MNLVLFGMLQDNKELIGPMDASELRAAMEQQAAAVGLRFEVDLANTLLDAVSGEPGAMPLVQHALLGLWERRHGRWLKADEYREMGGVNQAIASTADEVYIRANTKERERIREIFLRLTNVDEMGVRDGVFRDTRTRVTLEELSPPNTDLHETKELVQRLADAKLVVTDVNLSSGIEEIEVIHESLIRYWPRLSNWIEENRDGLRARQQLRDRMDGWNESGHESSHLLRGSQLSIVRERLDNSTVRLNKSEGRYLQASINREKGIRAIRLLGGFGLVVLALVFPAQVLQEWLMKQAASSEMEYVEAGTASLGPVDNSDDTAVGFRQVELPAFRIEKHEVSYAEYELCVNHGPCSLPRDQVRSDWRTSYDDTSEENNSYPVVNIDLYQAGIFCHWIGRRLPSETEWERVARHRGQGPWPWPDGSTPTIERVNTMLSAADHWEAEVVPVDSYLFAAGATSEGTLHLIGNVWEWTYPSDLCSPDENECTFGWRGLELVSVASLRGGSWRDDIRPVSYRLPAVPYETRIDFGFRCAQSD